MSLTNPLIVNFEGIDGSGKTTIANELSYLLETKYHKQVSIESEPYGEYGNFARIVQEQSISDGTITNERISDTILNLFIMDRFKHANTFTDNKSDILILDRYMLSTYAYQSKSFSAITTVHNEIFSNNIIYPDILILIDINPEIAIDRITKRSKPISYLETLDRLQHVRSNYLHAYRYIYEQQVVKTMHILDGNVDIDDILIKVENILIPYIK